MANGMNDTVTLEAATAWNPSAASFERGLITPDAQGLPARRDAAIARRAGIDLTRLMDVAGAALILIAALPFLVLLAIALQIDSPGRLFFVQKRIGRNGELFPCMKFRTMCENAEEVLQQHLASSPEARAEWAADHKLRNDPRVTRLGRIVRKLSLDEFPQLINILRGEMSLVGPRPIVTAEIDKYGRFFPVYCSVKPGLTGLWQVSGRNDVSYDQRVLLDRLYVRRKSLVMDIAILFQTIPAVLKIRGSY